MAVCFRPSIAQPKKFFFEEPPISFNLSLSNSAQAKLNSYQKLTKCKFRLKVPKNHEQAMELDKENKNDIWTQAGEQEIWELQCLNSFRSIGFKGAPLGHKTIPIFFVCDDVRISCEPGGRPSQACPSHCPRISPQAQASALETIANLAFPQKWAFPDSSH